MRQVSPWGSLPGHKQWVTDADFATDVLHKTKAGLAFAYGRTYGDACLADNGQAICLSASNRIEHFDPDTGQLVCQAMVSLTDILKLTVLQGWCLPVSPGTGQVSVAGAIANDVHGKNHHVAAVPLDVMFSVLTCYAPTVI